MSRGPSWTAGEGAGFACGVVLLFGAVGLGFAGLLGAASNGSGAPWLAGAAVAVVLGLVLLTAVQLHRTRRLGPLRRIRRTRSSRGRGSSGISPP